MYPPNYTTYKIPLQTALKIIPIPDQYIHHTFIIPHDQITRPALSFKLVAYVYDDLYNYPINDVTMRNFDIYNIDKDSYIQCNIVQNGTTLKWHININTNVEIYIQNIEVFTDVFDYKLSWLNPNNPDNIVPPDLPAPPPIDPPPKVYNNSTCKKMLIFE